MKRKGIFAALTAATVVAIAGCATPSTGGAGPAGPGDDPDPAAQPAIGEVLGQGTVLQVGEDAPQLCLGAVAESYPPQCSGSPIVGWDWAAVEQEESASGVTWGTYAVQGIWDGSTLTVTEQPIPLSLYDPMIDPHFEEGNAGPSSEAELAGVQADLDTLEIPDLLSSWSRNGYLFVQVVHDDGALQSSLDARYGPDVVVVQSALRPVTG